MSTTSIRELILLAHQNAKEKGFWDNPKTDNAVSRLLLMHSEISEAVEELRETKFDLELKNIHYYKDTPYGKKPEGFGVELADLAIRIFDLCGYLGIDLQKLIIEKMEYNRNRPHKHGGKRI